MVALSRYSIHDSSSNLQNGILKNKLGIQEQSDLTDLEALLHADTYTHFLSEMQKRKIVFDLSFLFEIHSYFLAPLYDWAGTVRSVDISKDGMMFAPIAHIHEALKQFDTVLVNNQPTHEEEKKYLHTNWLLFTTNLILFILFAKATVARSVYSLISWSLRSIMNRLIIVS